MIVMLLGAAMPTLYFAGLVLCECTFWGSKWLFLRFYRNPPKYGLQLASRVRGIIELSAIIHAFFGCYMLTNPSILPVQRINSNDVNNSFFEDIALLVGGWSSSLLGVNPDRFASLHGLAYLLGSIILLILYLVENSTGFVEKMLNSERCCLRKFMQKDVAAHSCNLYNELRPDVLNNEF